MLDLANEFLVLIVGYHLCLFTDFMPNVVVREHIGTSLVFFVCFSVFANLGITTIDNTKLVVRKCKIKKYEHKMRKLREASRQLRR